MARLRAEDRRAVLRPDDLRLAPALFPAERRAAFLADVRAPFLADFLPLFFADLPADFLAPREAFLVDRSPAALRLDFLADFLAGRAVRDRRLDDSSESSYEAGVEVGVGGGVFSIGSGSIQPEPDQPISI